MSASFLHLKPGPALSNHIRAIMTDNKGNKTLFVKEQTIIMAKFLVASQPVKAEEFISSSSSRRGELGLRVLSR